MSMIDNQPVEETEETAPPVAEFTPPVLDTDAMLAELHALTTVEEETEASELPDPTEEGEEPASEETAATDPGTEPAPSPPGYITGYIEFEGRQIPVEEARALIQLGERLRSDETLASKVNDHINKPAEPEPLPEWIDPENETAVKLYERQRELDQRLAAQEQVRQAQSFEEQKARAVSAFEEAVGTIRGEYPSLEDKDIAAIATKIPMGVIGVLEKELGSLPAAFEKAMTQELWGNPNLRSLVLESQRATVSADDRKKKISALTGSSGTSPRTQQTQRPTNRQGLLDQMLEAVRSDPDLQN